MEVLVIMNECSSEAMSGILSSVKNILTLISIIVPITLLVVSSINLFQLMMSPDDKKKLNRIKNSMIAAVVVFFIPTLVNAVMMMLGNTTDVSDCWNNAKSNNGQPQYIEVNEGKRNSIFSNPSDYEKGVKKESSSSSSSDSSSTSDGTTIDGTAKQIGDIVWDPNDVTKISNLTSSQLIKALTHHGGKAKNFIPYASALITAEHKYSVNVFFLIGIEATESGWITSRISQSCNNLGGVKASSYHPSNGCSSSFAYFSSVNEFIDYHGRLLHNNYLTPGASHYHGTTPSAVVTDYCPGCSSWPGTVTAIANSIFNDVAQTI